METGNPVAPSMGQAHADDAQGSRHIIPYPRRVSTMQDSPITITVVIEPCTGLCQKPCRLDRTRDFRLPLWLTMADVEPGEPNFGQQADMFAAARV